MGENSRTPKSAPTQNAATYKELLEDPFLADRERLRIQGDAVLGHTTSLLFQRGQRDLAMMLLEVDQFAIERDDEFGTNDLWLEFRPELVSHFPEDVVTMLRKVAIEVAERLQFDIQWLGVREVLPSLDSGWRDQLRRQVNGKRPTNHARKVRTERQQYSEDYLTFTNNGELVVYRALKQLQENEFPKDDTFGIYPLAGGRLLGRTWEPDVLVTFKKRAGVLEIDGPVHRDRAAMDMSRNHLFLNTGVAFVDRIPVEALNDATELKEALQRFLKRLAES